MGNSVQVLDVNAWHKQLALYMIARPDAKLDELSRHFKRTPTFISIVRNSDAFKAYYDGLIKHGMQESALGDIVQQTSAMTALALDKINSRLETSGDLLPVDTLLNIADTGLKRLGYGATKNSPAPTVAVNVGVVVPRSELEAARQRMTEAHGAGVSVKQLTAPEESPRHDLSKAVDLKEE